MSVYPNGSLSGCYQPSLNGSALSGDGTVAAWVSCRTPAGGEGLRTLWIRDLASSATAVPVSLPQGMAASCLVGSLDLSYDGRFLAFDTMCSLDAGDTGYDRDIYRLDLKLKTLVWISRSRSGLDNGSRCSWDRNSSHSLDTGISDSGRYVVFASCSDDLTADDHSNDLDVFVHDTVSGQIFRASVATDGAGSGAGCGAGIDVAISSDGDRVAFTACPANVGQVYVHDRSARTTTLASSSTRGAAGNNHSPNTGGNIVLSADGRFVAFQSIATDLVPGDTNQTSDVFVRDVDLGRTRRVSVSSDGVEGSPGHGCSPGSLTASVIGISRHGRYVTFQTCLTGLAPQDDLGGDTDVFVSDAVRSTTSTVTPGDEEAGFATDVAADGLSLLRRRYYGEDLILSRREAAADAE